MSPLADRLVREALLARDHSCRIPGGLLSPEMRAVHELVREQILIEAGRRVDSKGRVEMIYKLTLLGLEYARSLEFVSAES